MVKEARKNFAAVFKLKPELKTNITNRSMINLFNKNFDGILTDYAKHQGKISTADYVMQARAKMKQSKFEGKP